MVEGAPRQITAVSAGWHLRAGAVRPRGWRAHDLSRLGSTARVASAFGAAGTGLAAPARRCHPALTAVKLVVVGPGFGEAAGERPVALEEIAEHRRGGEEVADEDRPARQLVEHPLGQDHDRAE